MKKRFKATKPANGLMPRLLMLTFTAGLLITAGPALAAGGGGSFVPGTCAPDEVQGSGAIYRICMPSAELYNGDLVVWAHGYVPFNEPLEIPEDNLCGSLNDTSVCLNDLANILGFGFITTSYATNGLAIVPGVDDVVDLVRIFSELHGSPRRVYLVGASEGGIVTALAVERHPEAFDGGLSLCGPVGDFLLTTSYFGDFRVVFDYFFPDLMPGSATEIPESLVSGWDGHWQSVVRPAMVDRANRRRIMQLLRVTGAPWVRGDYDTVLRTIHDGLWYSVFATDDAVSKLGGQPFDNVDRQYRGSSDDDELNLRVQRVAAAPEAIATVDRLYQTTGLLSRPLITMHTDKDQQIPYEHETIYRQKVLDSGSEGLHRNFKIRRYGHCSFDVVEALLAFAVLYRDVNRAPVDQLDELLRDLRPGRRWEPAAPAPAPPSTGAASAPRARVGRRQGG